MQQPRIARPSRRLSAGFLLLCLAAVAAIGLGVAVAAAGKPSGPARAATMRVVKKAHNKRLDRTILVNRKGRTLYSLSAEKNGKFICKNSGCLSVWHPLTVPAGVTPTGPVKLGTIIRPDASTQVRYRGLPLYSFDGDTKPGQVKGEGIKDVGTWHAARVPKQHQGY